MKFQLNHRIISNYRLFLNKKITQDNIDEISARINNYSEALLEVICFNLLKNEEYQESIINFINRKVVYRGFDKNKMEILFPNLFETLLKTNKYTDSKMDELIQIIKLEKELFDFIRLGDNIMNSKHNVKNSIKNFNINQKEKTYSNKHFNDNILYDCDNDYNKKLKYHHNDRTYINNNFSNTEKKDYASRFETRENSKIFQINKHNNFTRNQQNSKDYISPRYNDNIFLENSEKDFLNSNKHSNLLKNLKFEEKDDISPYLINNYKQLIIPKGDIKQLTFQKSYIDFHNKVDYYETAEVENYFLLDSVNFRENKNIKASDLNGTKIEKSKEINKLTLESKIDNSTNTNKNSISEIIDFVFKIEDTKDLIFFNPLVDIVQTNKQNFNKNYELSINDNNQRLLKCNNENNLKHFPKLIETKTIGINNFNTEITPKKFENYNSMKIKVCDKELVFEGLIENNEENIESTNGNMDKYIIDDFSHITNEFDEFKKEKSYNFKRTLNEKPLKDEILRDPNSNINYYSRQLIPKLKPKSEKFKNTIPFLRNFNPKFLKKENIDKKIIRQFRNFIKNFMENNFVNQLCNKKKSLKNFLDKDDQVSIYLQLEKFKEIEFLEKFYKKYLLPPMKYFDELNQIVIEFKSFNTDYMLWLFAQEGIGEIYEIFTENLGNEIHNDFIEYYELEELNKKEEIGIIQALKNYIFSINKIYNRSAKKTYYSKKHLSNQIKFYENSKLTIKKDKHNMNKIANKTLDITNEEKNNEYFLMDNKIINNEIKEIKDVYSSEFLFDKCIDDFENKNSAMTLDFFSCERDCRNLLKKNFPKTLEMNEIKYEQSFKKLPERYLSQEKNILGAFEYRPFDNLNYFY